MANPKIFILVTELDIGGAEKNLFRLAVGLKERGRQVEVGCLSGRGAVGEWLEAESIPVHYVGMGRKWSPAAFWRLVKILRTARPDVLHTVLFHANIAGRLANIFARVGAVVSSVRVAERRRRSHLYMDFLTQWLVDREICVSEGVREFTRRRAHIAEGKLVVIPNGVEPHAVERSREEVRRELGVEEGEVVVLSVGRLERQKGYEYLLEAAKRVVRERPEAKFVVAGGGEDRGKLEAAIERAGLGARFTLLGWRADVGDLYGAADIFCLASLWEGMPNALLEAMAAGVACVATAVEGSREVIEDGRTGLLVAAEDSEGLAGALVRLVGESGIRERLAVAGREYVLERHSKERFIDAHMEVYRQLVS